MSVDDEAATTAPVGLAALREHGFEPSGGGVAPSRPDWLVVGAVAAGMAIVSPWGPCSGCGVPW